MLSLRAIGALRHAASRRLLSSVPSPSSTTTILLRHLPNSVTEDVLRELCKEPKMRKLELEPGFTCHTVVEADASYIAEAAQQQNLHCNVVNTSIPAMVLSNLPPHISHETIESAFQKYHPKRVQLIGTPALEVRTTLDSTSMNLLTLDRRLCPIFKMLCAQGYIFPRY